MELSQEKQRRVNLRVLHPLFRAYALGYLSSTGPRLLGFLRTIRRRDKTTQQKLDHLYTILRTSTELNRFPTSCAIIVGGATLLPRLAKALLRAIFDLVKGDTRLLLSEKFTDRLRFFCTLLSAWTAFGLLNQDPVWTRRRAQSRSSVTTDDSNFRSLDLHNQHHIPPPYHPNYAGKTIDFTLFAVVRAIDVLIVSTWTRLRSRTWHPEHLSPRVSNLVQTLADPSVFATSAAIIMWSWFYSPERLPRSYNQWISTAAEIDARLITALRLARRGEWLYGEANSNQAALLGSMCKDFGLPEEKGDPARQIPIPCELVHMGAGPSCEKHAITRFWRGFKFAMGMYLPLQMLVKLRAPSLPALKSAIQAASRSSAFLAGFISCFYYGVCLSRSRIGPILVGKTTAGYQKLDSGLCVLAGCLLCGWSIFLEDPLRRAEISTFVAPRALATLLPRVYDKSYRSREQAVFAVSVAIVMNAVAGKEARGPRGVFGKGIKRILQE